jgi:translation initiation factor 3 subunit G
VPPGIEPGITSLGDDITIIAKSKVAAPVEEKKEEVFAMNIVCRTCGKVGDHWTSKCPFKNRLQDLPEAPPQGGDSELRGRSAGGYVPPALRAGGSRAGDSDRGGERRRDYGDENTLRVSNLSENTTQGEVEDMFRPFGPTTRIFLARDKRTGQTRGFAFVSYIRKQDADKAIAAMNGKGHDHLILRVEYSDNNK